MHKLSLASLSGKNGRRYTVRIRQETLRLCQPWRSEELLPLQVQQPFGGGGRLYQPHNSGLLEYLEGITSEKVQL